MRSVNSFKKELLFFLKKKNDKFLQKLIADGLQLGKNVSIMQGCFLDPSHCFLIFIGKNTTLAPNVRLIAHDASSKKKTGYTKIGIIKIGSDCFIGDSTIVLPGVCIGDGTIIGAGSVVVADIPADCVAVGNPCRQIGSATNYFQKTEKAIADRKAPFSEFQQNKLTSQQKQDVVTFLSKAAGYIR